MNKKTVKQIVILFLIVLIFFTYSVVTTRVLIANRTKTNAKPKEFVTPNHSHYCKSSENIVESSIQTLGGYGVEADDYPVGLSLKKNRKEAVNDGEPFYYDVDLSHELQDYIRELSDEYSVPMSLVIAMIDTESNFNPDVVSITDDYGLMQINKVNHAWLRDEIGVTDFLDPYQNILSGVYIISGHLAKTDGDIDMALMRYNCGAGGAKKLWQNGIYSTDYSRKVTKLYDFYEKSRLGAGTP